MSYRRRIPDEYEPLAAQVLLNLALSGELDDIAAGEEALAHAAEINADFDAFIAARL